MTQKRCKYCKKIIVEDWEKWLIENPQQVYIQCNYCYELERIR